MLSKYLVAVAGILAATSVSAANLLPIKVGSYIGKGEKCPEANVFYPGGDASIGSPVSDCTIDKVSHKGALYSLSESCTDRQSHGTVSDRSKLLVVSPTSFKWIGAGDGTVISWCGPLPRE